MHAWCSFYLQSNIEIFGVRELSACSTGAYSEKRLRVEDNRDAVRAKVRYRDVRQSVVIKITYTNSATIINIGDVKRVYAVILRQLIYKMNPRL